MQIPIDAIIRFGDDWRTTHRVLNALATPVGWRYCQVNRYPKKRALAEAWAEVRSKWVDVLRQIDGAVTEGTLPWDNGLFLYHRAFHQVYKLAAADGVYQITLWDGKNRFVASDWRRKHIVIRWDLARETFEIL